MRKAFLLILIVLSSAAVAAQGYYADSTFAIEENGNVVVSGVSNHPLLQPGVTQKLTSKRDEYWLFNLTVPDKLDEFVLTVELPPGATLNYVSAKSTVNIIPEGDHITVKRIGSNSSIALVVQYRLDNQRHKSILPYIVGIVAVLVLIVSVFYVALAKKLVRKPKEHKHPISFVDGLPQRQKEILALLERSGGKLTQKQIEQHLKLPKSSVSRNIDALSRKGLVTKQVQGLTNTIRLVKE